MIVLGGEMRRSGRHEDSHRRGRLRIPGADG
jgi:hypothetical protein